MGSKRRTVLLAGVLVAAMSGVVAASVPLYRLFCKATGYAGTPRRVAADAVPAGGAKMGAGFITVRFDATVMRDMPWRFQPEQTSLRVRPGETELASFVAENLSGQPLTGTASFNVVPAKAAPYVDKIACFCFSAQRLEPGQRVAMPVSFFIDPRIAEDPQTRDVHTITLSYTFFRARQAEAQPPTDGKPREGGKS